MKELFKARICGLDSRQMMKSMRLKVTQHVAYKVTSKRKYTDAVADNWWNQNFNPVAANHFWQMMSTILPEQGSGAATDVR
jgi:hypothetical protein